jgi:hypothetical protein
MITKIAPPVGEEAAPEFVCPPLTATNSVSDTLELGDDCTLTFYPAPADASTTASVAKKGRSLQPRAALGTDCLYTSTSILTYTVHAITTITSTVTRQEVTETFSCPAMSVTNSVGDELSLNEKCQLEFSPGNSVAPASSASPTASGSVLPSGSSSGQAGNVASLLAWKAFVCLSLLTLICTFFL